MIKKVTEETLDSVLAVVRQVWAEKAGLKTYADAVTEVMETRQQNETKLAKYCRWTGGGNLPKGVSHEEARARAKSMDIDIFSMGLQDLESLSDYRRAGNGDWSRVGNGAFRRPGVA